MRRGKGARAPKFESVMMHSYAGAVLVLTFLLIATGVCVGFSPPPHLEHDEQQWLNHGGDLTNNRWARFEKQISTSSVQNLTQKWSFTTVGDVTATPSLADGVVYFPDWSGAFYAVHQKTGALVWKKTLTALAADSLGTGNKSLISRSAPTIAGDRLLVSIYGPCAVLALSRSTGTFLWGKVLDSHPYGVVTMSGTAYEGHLYIGSSSTEEFASDICCSFQGAFFKLDIYTGEVIWRVPMMRDNKGRTDEYAGNALWGSSPPIDMTRRGVYVATGNNYRVPEEIEQCELNYRNLTDPPFPDHCIELDNHAESVLAINIDTGDITWARHLGIYDTWIITCLLPNPGPVNCPAIPGTDYDFGQAPIFLTIPTSNAFHGRDVVVVGQKSGIVWALDRDSGEIIWDTPAGPGGFGGGSMWGITTDGARVFTNIVNSDQKNFTLAPGTTVINGSAWVGLNATTGQILWSTANPTTGWNPSPLTHANGVIFGGAMSGATGVFALDAETGEILKFIPTNASIFGGPSVSQGCSFQPLGIRGSAEPNAVVALCAPSAV